MMIARQSMWQVSRDIIYLDITLVILPSTKISETESKFFETKPVFVRQRLSMLPMVSHSLSCFTNIFYFYSSFAVLAKAMVTSKGMVSGRAMSIVKVTRIASTNSWTLSPEKRELIGSSS